VPAAEVELDDRDESFDGVLDLGDGEEHFGMAHETARVIVSEGTCSELPATRSSCPIALTWLSARACFAVRV
jgi:hypothetical protein